MAGFSMDREKASLGLEFSFKFQPPTKFYNSL